MLLGFSANGLRICDHDSLHPTFPVIVSAFFTLGLAEIDILAVVSDPDVEVLYVVRVEFDDQTRGEWRALLAVESLCASPAVYLLNAYSRRYVQIILKRNNVQLINSQSGPFQRNSTRTLDPTIKDS